MDEERMLTTKDNPFSPFDQWDPWDAFDHGKGYHSCAYLARVVGTISDLDSDSEIQKGMETIVNQDPFGIYLIVQRTDYNPQTKAS